LYFEDSANLAGWFQQPHCSDPKLRSPKLIIQDVDRRTVLVALLWGHRFWHMQQQGLAFILQDFISSYLLICYPM